MEDFELGTLSRADYEKTMKSSQTLGKLTTNEESGARQADVPGVYTVLTRAASDTPFATPASSVKSTAEREV